MEPPPEFSIVSSLVQPGASVEYAIQQLLKLTSAAASSTTRTTDLSDNPLFTHLNNVWRSLVEEVAANTAPSQQALLVEFVRTLRLQKVVDPATGDQLFYHLVNNPDYKIAVWTDLPLFGINVRDEWYFDANSFTPEDETRYHNKVAFLAQLTNSPENNVPHSETDPGPFDFSLYALWDLRDAFENHPDPGPASITLLRAAALWVIYCADRLWANVKTKRGFVHKASGSNSAQEGERYLREKKRWMGFNEERWGVWVQGMELGKEVADGGARAMVERALREMERVEDQSWRVVNEEKFK